MSLSWLPILIGLSSMERTQDLPLTQALVRPAVHLADCPSFEDFRKRGYARLNAEIVHPLRMLARTQAQAEKARCEDLRLALESALAKDWSGWADPGGMIEVGSDSQALDQARQSGEFLAVHSLALEVGQLDVVKNGNQWEHQATFLLQATSWSRGDSIRTLRKVSKGTGFGNLERAVEQLVSVAREAATSILEGPDFHRKVVVTQVDSAILRDAFRFVKGPGTMASGRRLCRRDSTGGCGGWAIAWKPVSSEGQSWIARRVGGAAIGVGDVLQEIPGALAWRLGVGMVGPMSTPGMEVRGGVRLPVGPSVRVGLDLAARSHDFASRSPSPAVLGWGGGVGLEPDLSFQRNVRRWLFEAGFRPGLRLDLAPVEQGTSTVPAGEWARRAELNATFHGSCQFARTPSQALGLGISYDAFQGRGTWVAQRGDLGGAGGLDPWRFFVTVQFWP